MDDARFLFELAMHLSVVVRPLARLIDPASNPHWPGPKFTLPLTARHSGLAPDRLPTSATGDDVFADVGRDAGKSRLVAISYRYQSLTDAISCRGVGDA